MRHIAKSLVVMGSLLAAGSASAMFDDISPLIGVDYYHAWTKGKNDYSQVFPKSYPGFTVYLGAKFCEYWGLELGFDSSGRKKKDFTLASGTSFFNGTTGTAPIVGQTKIRRQGGHLDVIGYLPLVDCLELTGSLGYGWVKPQITTAVSSQAGDGTGSALATALNSLRGKGKSVFRIGVGLSYMVTDMVGLRAKVGWETTSSLRVEGNQSFSNLGFSNKGFKSSTTLNVGAFVKF